MHPTIHPALLYVWKTARESGSRGISIGFGASWPASGGAGRSDEWSGPAGGSVSDSTDCGPRDETPGACRPIAVAVEPAYLFEGGSGLGGGPFGVRRPLRFLAHKLQLDDSQVAHLAAILDELKTERAQAAVDDRRTLTAFAEAMAGEGFDQARAAEAAALRSKSAERLSGAVAAALERIHKLLTPEQRARFAYLIRTGTVVL